MTGEAYWLPIVFVGLMGLSFLIYAILDGYDLGVGILLPMNNEHERDIVISSIGPFWDANETWLVLAVGILLIAFPKAHSLVLYHLYLPTAVMLIGLILRGVAFDFRTKASSYLKSSWDKLFKTGSIITSMSQGYMLGHYVMGFEKSTQAYSFALLSAICVTAGYAYIGAAWLIMKTEGDIQLRAAKWARRCGWLMAIGIISVCIVNIAINQSIFERWLSFPQVIAIIPIPVMCLFLFVVVDRYLSHFPHQHDFGCWIPFASAAVIFFLCFQGLAYSFFPYIVMDKITIWQAASAPESLQFILYGAIVVLPVILIYTAFSYRVFWGKTTELKYY
jgi:cytochrome bd ubiquinol oxidase subunit II